jgi:hypothetical protein
MRLTIRNMPNLVFDINDARDGRKYSCANKPVVTARLIEGLIEDRDAMHEQENSTGDDVDRSIPSIKMPSGETRLPYIARRNRAITRSSRHDPLERSES